jgi:ferric-dicitrate binding protein FerR (iron transport regulator)
MSHVMRDIDAVLTGSTRETPEFRAHVRGCAECRARYDATLSLLRLARGGIAPGELERITQRATTLARPPVAESRRGLMWAFAFGLAATVAVLAFVMQPPTQAGHVLVAGKGLTVDGALTTKDAKLFEGSEIVAGKEDSALLLDGAHGRRGLLLRPGTRVKILSSDEVTIFTGRLRVQVVKSIGGFVVRDGSARVVQTAPGIFVVEEKPGSTLVAVHEGSVRVNRVEVKAGQQTEVVGGVVGAPTAVTNTALVEDRPANIWDAFLKWINQLVDTIAKALVPESK